MSVQAKRRFREGNADPVVAIPKKLTDMLPGGFEMEAAAELNENPTQTAHPI